MREKSFCETCDGCEFIVDDKCIKKDKKIVISHGLNNKFDIRVYCYSKKKKQSC